MPQLVLGVLINRAWANLLAQQKGLNDADMYVQAAPHVGAYIYFFQRQDVNLHQQKIRGWVYQPGGGWSYQNVPWPHVYYDQVKIATLNNSRPFRRLRQELNQTVIPLNPVLSLPKWKSHLALSQYDDTSPLLPDTRRCRSARHLRKMLAQHPSILVKPDAGSWGRGICRVERAPQTGYHILLAESRRPEHILRLQDVYSLCTLYAGRRRTILQQEIALAQTAAGERCDMRITVSKNRHGDWEVVQSYLRAGRPGRFITNWHQGGRGLVLTEGLQLLGITGAASQQTQASLYAAALRIAARLEQSLGPLAEIGIDLALDSSRRLWLLEANAAPDKGTRPDDTWNPVPKIYFNILEYAQYLREKQRQTKADLPPL